MKRLFLLGLLSLIALMISTGCGETYRPIIIPNPPTFPNPAAAHTVVTISDNGTVAAGSAMVIDVAGDADVSEVNVGLAPVHAVQQTTNQVLVVNHSVSGAQDDSLTKLVFNGTFISSTQTVSLPTNSFPNFVAVAPTDTTAYVSLPNVFLDPAHPTNATVGVINTNSNLMANTITVGNNPVALAVTPDRNKLYVANEGDSTIGGFNTSDRSQRVDSPVHASSSPVWLVPRTDNQRVYVLESNGTLAWLDTTSTAGPDQFTETTISVPGAKTMTYDPNKNRLYIPGGQHIAIVDVSQSAPAILTGAPIAIPTVAPTLRATTDPCSLTSAQPLTVAAAAALPDGSRAYIGSYYEDSNANICPQVTVIDVTSNAIKSSIAVPGVAAYDAFCATSRFRINMAAAGSSTRAYLSSCDGGNVNFIDTSNDSYIMNLPAPIGTRQTVPPGPLNLPQSPVFLIAGP